MRRLHGFSLMEMMVVLTIVAIVAAASAPMVNKKMVRAASEKSPWVFVNGESIGYNIDNENGIQDRKTATIGANGRVPDNAGTSPRLYIDTNSEETPHILFGRDKKGFMQLIAGGDNNDIWFSSVNKPSNVKRSVTIGSGAITKAGASDAVAIGYGASAAKSSIAIGGGDSHTAADASGDGSIAMMNHSTASGTSSIAIGYRSTAATSNSIAIGANASSMTGSSESVVIGPGANASNHAQVIIGNGANSRMVRAVAIGNNTSVNGEESVAIGANATASNSAYCIAIGHESIAGSASNNGYAIALGERANATAQGSIAIGSGLGTTGNPRTSATAANSIAIGRGASATAASSIAIGQGSSATASRSVAIGQGVTAGNADTVVIGKNTDTVRVPGTLIPGELVLTKLRVQGDLIVDGNIQVKQNAYLNTSNTHTGNNNDPSANDYRTYMWIASRDKNRGACIAALQHRKLTDRHWIVQVGKQYGGGNLDDGDATGGDNNDYITPAAQNKIDELNTKISSLESKIAELEKKINSLSK